MMYLMMMGFLASDCWKLSESKSSSSRRKPIYLNQLIMSYLKRNLNDLVALEGMAITISSNFCDCTHRRPSGSKYYLRKVLYA
jgi:protein involved in sex pheromone biosynthesis